MSRVGSESMCSVSGLRDSVRRVARFMIGTHDTGQQHVLMSLVAGFGSGSSAERKNDVVTIIPVRC